MITLFRYPGAKNKLLVPISKCLEPFIKATNSFCDVFVGGGSVLCEVASNYPVLKLVANDKDYLIYSFWLLISSCSTNEKSQLFTLIDQKPTVELFYRLKKDQSTDILFCAYKAIFLNRCAFSGILKSNPIGGKEQQSEYKIDCRYNPKVLKNKIEALNLLLKNRLAVFNLDFRELDYLTKTDNACYLDPVYVQKGNELYNETMNAQDHKDLASILASRKNWLLSYDNCVEILQLYKTSDINTLDAKYSINGKKETWTNSKELLITAKGT